MKRLLVFVTAAVVLALGGCGKSDSANSKTSASSESANGEQLIIRCVKEAKLQGYKNGQCAATFIDTCIKTQSKTAMQDALKVDNMLGMVTGKSCPNMSSTYVAEFDKLDKF